MDTGRAGTIGTVSAGDLLGKAFFAKHDLLPRGFKLEALHTFPAPDFQFHSHISGALTVNKSQLIHTGTNGIMSTFGWNFGANYTRALFIVSTITNRNNNMLMLQDAQPTDYLGNSGKTLVFRNHTFNFDYDIYEATIWNSGFGVGVVNLGVLGDGPGSTGVASPMWQQPQFHPSITAMACYYDCAADVFRLFMRYGKYSWVEAGAYASTKLASIRVGSILSFAESGEMRYDCPFGLYAGN